MLRRLCRVCIFGFFFFISSRRRHTRSLCDWSSDVCSSDLPADATIGPDLTHLASRTTLAALTLPNDATNLAHWIEDPQRYKPGSKMPGFALTERQIAALVAYLDGLK